MEAEAQQIIAKHKKKPNTTASPPEKQYPGHALAQWQDLSKTKGTQFKQR